jgi:murein endopeptidase
MSMPAGQPGRVTAHRSFQIGSDTDVMVANMSDIARLRLDNPGLHVSPPETDP